MKKILPLLLFACLLVSCSGFHVKNEIKNGSALKKLKHTGIIIRVTHNTPIELKYFNRNMTQWLEPYKKINNITLLVEISKNLNTARGDYNRFLQFSADKDFQYYQTMGIIAGYLKSNREELDNLKSENGLDSFLIYEVDGSYSSELQFSDFNSMAVIVDGNYQIVYMDRQADSFEAFEIDKGILREDLLDQVSNRLLDLMFKLGYLKEK
ncbi:MAG: hypothetical protein JXA07_06395 [Spirochaetes bacterium]|nr:hypothetical protein [Spirochaetota bacterium]